MTKRNLIAFLSAFFLLTILSQPSMAQDDSQEVNSGIQKNNKNEPKHRENIIKTNIAGFVLKNYSLQYERVLNRKISVALQYRVMPETGIPFKNSLNDLINENGDSKTQNIIDDFKLSNFSITPEVRIYLSKKGYGQGIYFAPFYRYASFNSNTLNVSYEDENQVEQNITLAGKLTTNTGGFGFGFQKFLGNIVVLDVCLIGPHFGSGKGDFDGTSTKLLSPEAQDNIRKSMEDLDIPFTRKTIDVNENSASLKLDGPWGGYRFLLSLGIRF